MKRYKYKGKTFSGITMLREDAETIRKIAQYRNLPVYKMTEQIVEEWANWKAQEEMQEAMFEKKTIDKRFEIT